MILCLFIIPEVGLLEMNIIHPMEAEINEELQSEWNVDIVRLEPFQPCGLALKYRRKSGENNCSE